MASQSGASAFGVWGDGVPLAYWPARDVLEQPSLRVPVYYEHRLLDDLRVSGLYDIQSQERLAAEAALVSYLIRLEEEMNTLVADLSIARIGYWQSISLLVHYDTIQRSMIRFVAYYSRQ